jgi:hypothetical protein
MCFEVRELVRRGAVPHAIVTIVNELRPRIKLTIKGKRT